MAINIHTNISSLRAQSSLNKSTTALQKNLMRLSSGFRVNSAADDAAGLAISEEMSADLRSYAQASRNTNDGVSMLQTAESALGEITGVLSRMRELAMQSASDGVNDTQRGFIQTEITELTAEIDRIVGDVEYNGTVLLDGSLSVDFQVGLDSGDTLSLSLSTNFTAGGDLSVSGVDLSSKSGADSALADIDAALEVLNTARATIGAKENRLNIAQSSLASSYEALSAAQGRIRDVDVAAEMAALTKNQILAQMSTAMLAQANSLPQMALSLLG